jgi:hypothetical protein
MNAHRSILLVFALVGAVAIPVVCFKNLTPPYFWIGCGYLIIALGLLFFLSGTGSTVLLINLAVVITILTGFEAYLYSIRFYKEGTIENVYDGKYVIDHPDLGYTLAGSLSRPEATKYLSGELVYRVSYSTNEHGLRRSMGESRAAGRFGCILVYGGSFAYAEGVN